MPALLDKVRHSQWQVLQAVEKAKEAPFPFSCTMRPVESDKGLSLRQLCLLGS